MFLKRDNMFVLVVLVALLLAGCDCTNEMLATYFVTLDSPTDYEIFDHSNFEWHGNQSCKPDKFFLTIKENIPAGGDEKGEVLSGDTTSFTLPVSYLLPGREYRWRVRPENQYDPDEQGDYYGHESPWAYFRTGPICSGEALVAPKLLDPDAGGWLNKEHVFKWTYTGGCLPSSYEIQFAHDQEFNDIYLTTSPAEPYAQELLMAFPDCSSMFWRVRASDGNISGPWSESRDFHYVISENCSQVIYVWLAFDRCDQTGEIAAWTQSLHTGCVVEGPIIVGGGDFAHFGVDDFTVDLGSGPCPSTGLDQIVGEYNPNSYYYEARFDVMAPGTYCVSISKNQNVKDLWGDQVTITDLMDGIWTRPRTDQVIAEQTIEIENDDMPVTFMWDKVERAIIKYPLDYTYDCKIGPEKICPTYDFAPAGEEIMILARDRASDWKLTALNGELCYINLPDEAIVEALAQNGLESSSLDVLEYFHPPEPCSDPGTDTDSITCAWYTDAIACRSAGCDWVVEGRSSSGKCVPRD